MSGTFWLLAHSLIFCYAMNQAVEASPTTSLLPILFGLGQARGSLDMTALCDNAMFNYNRTRESNEARHVCSIGYCSDCVRNAKISAA